MRFRPNTIDESVQHDMVEYEDLNIIKGDVVLDLGGHIGWFAKWAYGKGACYVMSVEPDPDNARIHRNNLPSTHRLLEAACTSNTLATMVFYAHNDFNTASGSLISRPKREPPEKPIRVLTVDFQKLLKVVQPRVLKCDIEGGEYKLDWTLSDCVQAVAIEFHFLPDSVHKFEPYEDMSGERDAIERRLFAQGFQRVYITSDQRFWMTSVYRRPQ